MKRTYWTTMVAIVLSMGGSQVRAMPGGGNTHPMGRLRTVGFEIKGVSTNANALFSEGQLVLGTPTINTTTVRSGSNSLKCDSGAGNSTSAMEIDLRSAESVLGRTYFIRVYINFTENPTANQDIVQLLESGTLGCSAVLSTTGTLHLGGAGGVQVGSASAVLNTNQWYRVELSLLLATGAADACELRLDGVTIASQSGVSISDIATSRAIFGWPSPASLPGANHVIFFDDIAWNDDQGSSQNSFPGEGKEVFLKPISDNAVGTGWVDGDGVGTLFGSVDNAPPAGAATPADGTQIKNLTSTTTGNYDTNVTDYLTAGITSADTITLVQAVCDHAEAIATGTKTGGLLIVSNPTQSVEDTFTYGDDTGAMGAWPSNWRNAWGTAQYAPSVTLGTSPVLRVGKRTATTREVDVDMMGIYVEYVPATATVFLTAMSRIWQPL